MSRGYSVATGFTEMRLHQRCGNRLGNMSRLLFFLFFKFLKRRNQAELTDAPTKGDGIWICTMVECLQQETSTCCIFLKDKLWEEKPWCTIYYTHTHAHRLVFLQHFLPTERKCCIKSDVPCPMCFCPGHFIPRVASGWLYITGVLVYSVAQ